MIVVTVSGGWTQVEINASCMFSWVTHGWEQGKIVGVDDGFF